MKQIRELSSLTDILGFTAKELYTVSNNVNKHYLKRYIPKSNGDLRELSVPDSILKKIQKSIACNLLTQEEISPYAMAYRKGGSTVENAAPHVRSSVILKLDIKHFFDHIIYPSVKEKVFSSNRYSEKIRILLTILCMYRDGLPQGAPTSPAISNIILRDFDNLVGEWCRKKGIRYTRYCDDMTFSGKFEPKEVINFIKEELLKIGFFLNRNKITVARKGQKQIVTGIVINDKLSVPYSYRKNIRQAVYYCKKYGVLQHMEKSGIKLDEKSYLRKLIGRVNYVLSVDPLNLEMLEYEQWLIDELRALQM